MELDPEIEKSLPAVQSRPTDLDLSTPEAVAATRAGIDRLRDLWKDSIDRSGVVTETRTIPGAPGMPDLELRIAVNVPRSDASSTKRRPSLTRFAWLSIGAAVLTISLKAGAYFLTGSVGLLSDALESLVNLVAAVGALIALAVSEREPTEEYAFGYEKAEYFASGLEGALILAAAVGIVVTAVPRLLHPEPISGVGLGLGISTAASLINFGVARRLFQAGREYGSITLEADARHLMTDVWTSAGVIGGVAAVALTGWEWLDPVIALAVAANIVWTGTGLVRRSISGLLDRALPPDERDKIQTILGRYQQERGIQWHALRTRQAGRRRFVSVHVLVPGNWTVHRGHQLLEELEGELRAALPALAAFTHLESLDDPAS